MDDIPAQKEKQTSYCLVGVIVGRRVGEEKQLITVFQKPKPPKARSWRREPVERRTATMRRWWVNQLPKEARFESRRCVRAKKKTI